MGHPALKMEPRKTQPVRPRLRVVKGARRKTAGRTAAASAAVCRRNFRMFATLVAVVALLGMGRVWLTVEAAQASHESSQLRETIKAERYEGDMLEVRQSALGSPSRIRAIAGTAMDMAPASSVSYLDLAKTKKAVPAEPVAETNPTRAGVDGWLERIMDLTAGEAQVLLVGDVGLASAR